MQDTIQFELTREFVDYFRQWVKNRDDLTIRQVLESVKPADISALLYEFNSEESKYVLDLLPAEVQAEIIKDLDEDTRKQFLKIYSTEEIAALVNLMASDDAADILNDLPVKVREEVLGRLEGDLRAQVIDLLRFEENVAGGLMAKELIKVRQYWTVEQCLEEIRKQAEVVDKFYAVYVVDEND